MQGELVLWNVGVSFKVAILSSKLPWHTFFLFFFFFFFESWTAKYLCRYLNWKGNLKTSSLITWTISFNNFLFKGAAETSLKFNTLERSLISLLFSWKRSHFSDISLLVQSFKTWVLLDENLFDVENLVPIKSSLKVLHSYSIFSFKPYGEAVLSFNIHSVFFVFFMCDLETSVVLIWVLSLESNRSIFWTW